jgi:hypothetical protein
LYRARSTRNQDGVGGSRGQAPVRCDERGPHRLGEHDVARVIGAEAAFVRDVKSRRREVSDRFCCKGCTHRRIDDFFRLRSGEETGSVLNEDCVRDLGEEQFGAGRTDFFARDAAQPIDRVGLIVDERSNDGARVEDDVRRCGRDRDPSE